MGGKEVRFFFLYIWHTGLLPKLKLVGCRDSFVNALYLLVQLHVDHLFCVHLPRARTLLLLMKCAGYKYTETLSTIVYTAHSNQLEKHIDTS